MKKPRSMAGQWIDDTRGSIGFTRFAFSLLNPARKEGITRWLMGDYSQTMHRLLDLLKSLEGVDQRRAARTERSMRRSHRYVRESSADSINNEIGCGLKLVFLADREIYAKNVAVQLGTRAKIT